MIWNALSDSFVSVSSVGSDVDVAASTASENFCLGDPSLVITSVDLAAANSPFHRSLP